MKTCKRGHAKIPENRFSTPAGKSGCIICKRMTESNWKKNNKELYKSYFSKSYAANPGFSLERSKSYNKGWESVSNRRKYWTKEEEMFVLNSTLPIKQVADELNRSYESIRSKRAELKKEQENE